MKKIIGYILIASPIIVTLVVLGLVDWKALLITIGGITFFACCFIIGAKLIE
jgi:hypothetical protein